MLKNRKTISRYQPKGKKENKLKTHNLNDFILSKLHGEPLKKWNIYQIVPSKINSLSQPSDHNLKACFGLHRRNLLHFKWFVKVYLIIYFKNLSSSLSLFPLRI